MSKSSYLNGRFIWVSMFTAFITAIVASSAILIAFFRLPESWLDIGSRIWARSILRVSGMTVTFEGLENFSSESAVLISNHQGFYDILVLLAYLPRPPVFVAKASVFRVPLFGQAMKAVGHIPIDRSNREKAIASIQKGTLNLKKHKRKVVFFPEGTRTRDGEMKPFKKGAFVFAIESGLPLIPLAIEGSYQALPPKRKAVCPGNIHVKILPPITSSDYSIEQRDELLNESYQVINEAVTALRKPKALDPEAKV